MIRRFLHHAAMLRREAMTGRRWRGFATNATSDADETTRTPVVTVRQVESQSTGMDRVAIEWQDDEGESVNADTTHHDMEESKGAIRGLLHGTTHALNEAIASRQLKSLILRVDSEYVTRAIAKYLPQWEQAGYVARVGRPVKYGEEFARIAQLMKMIKVQVELVPKQMVDVHELGKTEWTIQLNPADSSSNAKKQPSYTLTKASDDAQQWIGVPEAYVTGVIHKPDADNRFITVGVGVVWRRGDGARGDHGDMRFIDCCQRVNLVPVTQTRAQLAAIRVALKEVRDELRYPLPSALLQ